MASEIKVDTISEKTSANGVSIDSVTLKDGGATFTGAVTVGVDDAGHDVKFFGDTASAYMLWDTSADDLVLAGAAGIDLAGDIDVDGTANLDVVDIDGAVDMASTLQVDGVITTSDGMIITTADNTDTLSLISTDADANTGPNLVLYRNSGSPADNDVIGRIEFQGKDDGGNTTIFAQLTSQIIDVTGGSEDSSFALETFQGGSMRNTMDVRGATGGTPEVVFNDGSFDMDFRVESNGNANMLTVNAGADLVGIGADPDLGVALHVKSADSGASVASDADELVIEGSGSSGLTILAGTSSDSRINFGDSGTNDQGKVTYNHTNDYLRFDTSGSEKARIDSSGNIFIAKTGSSATTVGCQLQANGQGVFTAASTEPVYINRQSDDGNLVSLRQADSQEGTITVSGTTVAYNTFCGAHWSRLADNSKPTILRGTVMESIATMMDWYQAVADVAEVTESTGEGEKDVYVTPAHQVKESIALPDGKSVGDAVTFTSNGKEHTGVYAKEDNEQLPMCKVSDASESKAVYGVFMAWDDADDGLDGDVNDMHIAALGAFVVRVHSGETVAIGDYLQSNGDGTAKVQADDIMRASTIAKVTSTEKTITHGDGSYCVPCTLHCG